jgi:hypothetical protein
LVVLESAASWGIDVAGVVADDLGSTTVGDSSWEAVGGFAGAEALEHVGQVLDALVEHSRPAVVEETSLP